MDNKNTKAIKAAFPKTIPVLTGFRFIAIAYALTMKESGFSWVFATLISLLVFGGSLQFAAISVFLAKFNLPAAFMLALVVQMRHIFYGISMLKKYSNVHGLKKFLMIFTLCDETFSIVCTENAPEGVDQTLFLFWVSMLDWTYWWGATLIGGIIGMAIPFDLTGIDFSMTALFVVIFVNQLSKEEHHTSSAIGLCASLICLQIFGRSSFLIPAMVVIFSCLMLLRKRGNLV